MVEQGGPALFSDINVGTLRAIASGDGMFVAVGGTRFPPYQLPVGKIFSSPTGDNPWTSYDRFIDPWPETYFQLQNLLLDVCMVQEFLSRSERAGSWSSPETPSGSIRD